MSSAVPSPNDNIVAQAAPVAAQAATTPPSNKVAPADIQNTGDSAPTTVPCNSATKQDYMDLLRSLNESAKCPPLFDGHQIVRENGRRTIIPTGCKMGALAADRVGDIDRHGRHIGTDMATAVVAAHADKADRVTVNMGMARNDRSVALSALADRIYRTCVEERNRVPPATLGVREILSGKRRSLGSMSRRNAQELATRIADGKVALVVGFARTGDQSSDAVQLQCRTELANRFMLASPGMTPTVQLHHQNKALAHADPKALRHDAMATAREAVECSTWTTTGRLTNAMACLAMAKDTYQPGTTCASFARVSAQNSPASAAAAFTKMLHELRVIPSSLSKDKTADNTSLPELIIANAA